MSEDNKTVELNDEELEQATGGAVTICDSFFKKMYTFIIIVRIYKQREKIVK